MLRYNGCKFMLFESASSTFMFIPTKIMHGLHMKCNCIVHGFQSCLYCLCSVSILKRFYGLKIGTANLMCQFHEVPFLL
jgi:hypothetical protein